MRTYRRIRWSLAFASLVAVTFLALSLDANQPDNSAGALASLDSLQSDSAAIGSETTSDDMDALAKCAVLMDARNAVVPIVSSGDAPPPTDLIRLSPRSGDTEAAAGGFQESQLSATPVPEPEGLVLISMGLVGLGTWRSRQG